MFSDGRSRVRFGAIAISCVALVVALCAAIPADAAGPATTTLLGPVLTKDENPTITMTRDGGLSVALPNGKDLWLFGDTPTVEYTHGAWKVTRFIAGNTAGIGPYTPRQVPAPLTELAIGGALKPDNQPARFIPLPNNIYLPDGSGRLCNQANGAAEPAGRWLTGAALMPDNTNVLITYTGACVGSLSVNSISVQSFGFMEYDWTRNKISVPPVDVFPPVKSGTALPRGNWFGSPVVSNNQVTLFSETCCTPANFLATTIPADVTALSNPASYVTHAIPNLQPAVHGVLDATVATYAAGELQVVTRSDTSGHVEVYSAPSVDGPWSLKTTATLPGCPASADPCYGIVGHPELSTSNALFVTYYQPGHGPGVPGHPHPHPPVNHLVMASIALGPGPPPDPAPVPTGKVPSKPTGVRAATSPTKKPTGVLTVKYKAGSDNGSIILWFTATCRSRNGGVTKTAVHTGSTAPAIDLAVKGVTTRKTYTCTITATNGWGVSPASVASPAVIVGAQHRP